MPAGCKWKAMDYVSFVCAIISTINNLWRMKRRYLFYEQQLKSVRDLIAYR